MADGAGPVPETFDRLMADKGWAQFPGMLTADQVAHQRWLQETRRSVLDSVAARGSLREKLGAGDRLRLDAHLQEVRELESRVASVAPPTVGLCQKPMDPGPDPQVGSGQLTDSTTGNITYTQNLGYSGEDARAQVITELVAMAMICDLTRSTLLQFTNSQSFMNMFQITGQRSDLHELSHGSHG